MMKNVFFSFAAISLLFSCSSEKPATVLVLPTIHGAHEINEQYAYEDLFSIINTFDPEEIGIEIRPEDIEQSNEYLDPFYPAEMMMVKDSFPDLVTGLDFYGKSAEGKLLNPNVFKDTTTETGKFVYLSKAIAQDSVLNRKYEQAGLPEIYSEQKKMALSSSPAEFLEGKYDSLTERQYHLEDSLLRNTEYEEYLQLNTARDKNITNNALELIRKNPSERILILVGANHRNRLIDSLRKANSIKLVEDLDFVNKSQ